MYTTPERQNFSCCHKNIVHIRKPSGLSFCKCCGFGFFKVTFSKIIYIKSKQDTTLVLPYVKCNVIPKDIPSSYEVNEHVVPYESYVCEDYIDVRYFF